MVLIALTRAISALSRMMPRAAARLAVWLTCRTRRAGASQRFGHAFACHPLPGGETVLHAASAVQDGSTRVLLVHGWNGAATDWTNMARTLREHGHDVFAVDLPGHGTARGTSSSLPRFVRALETIEREHGPFDIWVAHSMGANAAIAAMVRGAKTQRLILISPLVWPRLALRGFARAFGLSAESTEDYLATLERIERMRLDDLDAPLNARLIAIPVLVVHDAGDRMIPVADARTLAAAFASGGQLITSGLGHRRVLDDAGVIDEIAAFATASSGAQAP